MNYFCMDLLLLYEAIFVNEFLIADPQTHLAIFTQK